MSKPPASPSDAIWRPSPNVNDRRGGLTPSLIMLHFTRGPDADWALDRYLLNPQAQVSAHYLIARDGTLFHLVDEEKRAWHAGAGTWGGVADVNSQSIGIELDNDGLSPFSAPLCDRMVALVADIRARWSIPAERVIGHSDIAPERKDDPGRRFDWRRLALSGQSVWSEATGGADASQEAFLQAAGRFGYPTEDDFADTVDAFRQRFRPWAYGPLTADDVTRMRDLADRFPVDRGAVTA